MLERFTFSAYYQLGYKLPYGIEGTIDFADSFTPVAGPLMTEYYSDKYQAKIELVSKGEEEEYLKYFQGIHKENQEREFARQASVLNFGKYHSKPLIYIKEKDKVAFLYLNSLGIKFDEYEGTNAFFKKLSEATGAMIFSYREGWQADSHSCHVASLVSAAKATGIDPETGEYLIQHHHFISTLEERSTVSEGIYFRETRLPPELQFLIQYPDSFEHHKGDDKYTEKQTKNRYEKYSTQPNHLLRKTPYYHYLETKSLKLANLIEIQFYINQLKQHYPQWTPDRRKDFIKQAKKILATQGYVTCNKDRPGLYEFANKFLSDALPIKSDEKKHPNNNNKMVKPSDSINHGFFSERNNNRGSLENKNSYFLTFILEIFHQIALSCISLFVPFSPIDLQVTCDNAQKCRI